MKHLALLLFFALAADAQIFGPAARLRKGAGDPSAGECASASDVGKVWVKTDTGDDSYPLSVCANNGVGTYGWVAAGSGGGGSGDITGVTAGTGLTGGGTSGGVTLSLATITASRAMVSDGSGYPTASSVTATELGYLSGVTSAIQTQLGTKATIGTIGTAGRNVYVSGSSTITEDASFVRAAAGQYTLYDAIGPNTLLVRAGSSQSTSNLLAIQNSAGSNIFLIDSTGAPFASAFYNTAGLSQLSGYLDLYASGAVRFSSTSLQGGSKDLGLARSSANNLAVTNGSSTTYWTLGAGGILAGTDNSIDIGASGANRPRNVFIAGYSLTSGAIYAGSSINFGSGATSVINGSGTNGNIVVSNAAGNDFGRLQFGGTTSSFPALKRNSAALSARLADDSGDAPISASLFRTCQTEADGCWQFTVSGSDMLLQYRTGGAWVTKATWAP